MSNNTVYALAFAVMGMGTKFLVFMLNWDYIWSTQLYFLYLLLAIFFGVRETFIQKPSSSFKSLFKTGAQVGAVFTLLITLFTFVYYRWIDDQFFPMMIQGKVDEAMANQYDAENLEQVKSTVEFVFSSSTHSTVTLIGFMVLSLSYSALVSFMLTKIPFLGRPLK